jgi:hypothetical protein
MSQENVEIVRRAIEAWKRRDLPTMRASWRSDAEVDWSRSRGPLQGVYQGGRLKTVSSEFWSTFEEVELETHGFRQVRSEVVVPNIAHMRGAAESK